jgi:putative intracellular protease/amidase
MSLPIRPDRHVEALARPGTQAFDDQRLLLLELLVDPPAEGDTIAELATALGRPAAAISTAAAALARAGLAERRVERVRASEAARGFDALWPVCL